MEGNSSEWAKRFLEEAKKKEIRDIGILRGKTETFFFTNFPDVWDETCQINTFSQYGCVLDVSVAKKKSKWGKRFGFVRFSGIMDSSKLEARLNGIWLGAFKLRINIARFQRRWEPRKTEKVDENQFRLKLRSVIVCNNKKVGESLSFADAVRSNYERGRRESFSNTLPLQQQCEKVTSRETHDDEEGPDIIISTTKEKIDACKRSLVGKVKNVDILRNLFNFTSIEGIANVETFYLGGLYAQLQFQEVQAAEIFRLQQREVWRNWFDTLQVWEPSFRVDSRVVAVRVLGIPTQSLSDSTLTEIGSLWGEVILTQGGGKDEKDRSKGVIGIVVPHLIDLKETIKLRIDNNDFMVKVIEDEERTRRLLPEIKALDDDSAPPSDDDMWDEHIDEVNEIDEEEIEESNKEKFQPDPLEKQLQAEPKTKQPEMHSGDDRDVLKDSVTKDDKKNHDHADLQKYTIDGHLHAAIVNPKANRQKDYSMPNDKSSACGKKKTNGEEFSCDYTSVSSHENRQMESWMAYNSPNTSGCTVGHEEKSDNAAGLGDNGLEQVGFEFNGLIEPKQSLMGLKGDVFCSGLSTKYNESSCIKTHQNKSHITGGGFIVEEQSSAKSPSDIGSSANSEYTEMTTSSVGLSSNQVGDDHTIEVNHLKHSSSPGEFPFMESIAFLEDSIRKNNRKKHRDLKMKKFADIQCHCKNKKKGVKCCHEINSGNVVNAVFLAQRNGDSSGSESYISKANSRLRFAMDGQKQFLHDKNRELNETINIGEKIGFIFSKENHAAFSELLSG